MDWHNEQLIRIIQLRSRDLDFLQTVRPQVEQLENNPLYEDNIRVKAVRLRLKLDKIVSGDKESSLLTDIVDGIELSSGIELLSRDHSYTQHDIDQFLNYHTSLEDWKKENGKIERTILGRDNIDLEPFTMVINARDNTPILMLSGNNNCRSIGLYERDNVIGDLITQYSSNFYRMNEEQIENTLEGVDFNNLRKRLVNAGYVDTVSLIDKEVMKYF